MTVSTAMRESSLPKAIRQTHVILEKTRDVKVAASGNTSLRNSANSTFSMAMSFTCQKAGNKERERDARIFAY